MTDDEGWLYKPAMRGLCRYIEVDDGTLSLEQIARMNDLLDVQDENQARWQEAIEREREKHGGQ